MKIRLFVNSDYTILEETINNFFQKNKIKIKNVIYKTNPTQGIHSILIIYKPKEKKK